MKTLHRTMLALLVAVAVTGASHAQSAAPGKGILVGSDQRLYLVDHAAGQAILLPKSLTQDALVVLSPDGTQLAVAGKAGLAIYSASASGVALLRQVTGTPTTHAAWSDDGRYLSFLQEVPQAGGGAVIQAFVWDNQTSTSKRAL